MNRPQSNIHHATATDRQMRGRVLVVDDEPMARRGIARLLRDQHDVETAGSAAEALERLRAGAEFDAILSDVMMPGGSGLDLLGALLTEFPPCADRVVFMTGGADESLRERIARNQNICLDKPVDLDTLRAAIDQTVARTQRAAGPSE
jgi:CheY-like chemotaxis protein